MKKLLTLFLILALILPSAALSDVDLSGMTFDELVVLREQLNLAIWNSQEWQEVTVPVGTWKIGEDIPEGHWTIRVPKESKDEWARIIYCPDESAPADGKTIYINEVIYREDADSTGAKRIDLECESGYVIKISRSSMVFTPYAGKPDLGFKQGGSL